MRSIFLLAFLLTITTIGIGQQAAPTKARVLAGAERMEVYLPFLKGKKVGVYANQTSVVGWHAHADSNKGYTHLVDTLLKKGVKIVSIFAPEHGFRGEADAGEHVASTKDKATGIPIISLYGANRKPTAEQLKAIDVLIFDIQDVGVRFYTYISSLEEVMEACLINDKPLLLLDRPNPNGFYVDGPILEEGYQSFVGMQKIPIVYGMTIAEYSMMLNGEKWLSEAAQKKVAYNITHQPNADTPFHHQIIKCKNYTHSTYYELPVRPSPNLPNMQSILLYPSTCYFEGTEVSLGRGTPYPFQIYGHPAYDKSLFSFTPVSSPGAKTPPLQNKKCYGYDLTGIAIDITKPEFQKINLSYLIRAYEEFPDKNEFFLRPKKSNPKGGDYFFNKLTGNETLMKQIMNGKTEAEIRASWQPGLENFKKIRAKYLLYP